jgi:E3 ubiquitin-protein ligase DOA10
MIDKVPWYQPGPKFEISDALKEFLLMIVLTFILGGLTSVIALIESVPEIIPPQYVAYSGLFLAILHTIYNIVKNYKNGL